MLDCSVPSDFVYFARQSLMACRMGLCSTIEYTDKFLKCLLYCADVLESEAKSIFEMVLVNWLSALVLLYNCAGLHKTILCAEYISSI